MKVWLWIIKLIIWYNKFDLWILHQVDVWYNEIIKNMSNNHQNLISVSSLSLTQINSGEVLILGPIGYG